MPENPKTKRRLTRLRLRGEEVLYLKMSLLKRKPKTKPVRSLKRNIIRKIDRAFRK